MNGRSHSLYIFGIESRDGYPSISRQINGVLLHQFIALFLIQSRKTEHSDLIRHMLPGMRTLQFVFQSISQCFPHRNNGFLTRLSSFQKYLDANTGRGLASGGPHHQKLGRLSHRIQKVKKVKNEFSPPDVKTFFTPRSCEKSHREKLHRQKLGRFSQPETKNGILTARS